MFENPRRGRQARNFTTNVPKILDLKSSSEQIFPENCRWVPLTVAVPLQNLTGLTDIYLVFLILLVAGRVASRKKYTRGIFHDVGYTIQ